MEKSLKFCLNIFICICFFSCKTDKEKVAEAIKVSEHTYQGTAANMNALAYVLENDPKAANEWREYSIPYLKRGMPRLWKPAYDQAAKFDPTSWIPNRGYLYLWFYRDYKKAIADFNASDSITPNFIDHPQGHSVDYWRGIAYLGLKEHNNAIAYFNKHILKETQETGEDWVEISAFIYRGIAHLESGNNDLAKKDFNKAVQYAKQTADAHYYLAKIALNQGDIVLAKEMILKSKTDFNNQFYMNRPYVETLRQIYMEDLLALENQLENLWVMVNF